MMIGDDLGQHMEAVARRLLGDPDYPAGDNVQATERWQPPDFWQQLPPIVVNAILDEIAAGPADGERYSSSPAAKKRAAWPIVHKHAPDLTEDQARKAIATWLKNRASRSGSTIRRRSGRTLRASSSTRSTGRGRARMDERPIAHQSRRGGCAINEKPLKKNINRARLLECALCNRALFAQVLPGDADIFLLKGFAAPIARALHPLLPLQKRTPSP